MRKTRAIESLKLSSNITTGVKWRLVIFSICLGLINLGGILLLGIGLIFTLPWTIFSVVILYKKLSGTTSTPTPTATQPATPEPPLVVPAPPAQ